MGALDNLLKSSPSVGQTKILPVNKGASALDVLLSKGKTSPAPTPGASNTTPIPVNRTLPAFLGGGTYKAIPGNPNALVKTPRPTDETQYEGLPTKPGYERADIIPVSLGGINASSSNITMEKNLPLDQQEPFVLTATDKYLRDVVLPQYRDGKISLREAEQMSASFLRNEQEGLTNKIKNQNAGGKVGEFADKIVGFFQGIKKEVKDILGTAKDTVKNKVVEIAKTVTAKDLLSTGLTTARIAATTGGSLDALLVQGAAKIMPSLVKPLVTIPQRAVTSVALEPAKSAIELLTGKKTEAKFTPTTPLEKIVFGEEPIYGMFTRTKDAEDKINQTLNKIGLNSDTAKGMALAIAPLFVGGSISLDLTPIGGEAKTAEKVAASSNIDDIVRLIKPLFKDKGEEELRIIAEPLININKADEVKRYLQNQGDEVLKGVVKEFEDTKALQGKIPASTETKPGSALDSLLASKGEKQAPVAPELTKKPAIQKVGDVNIKTNSKGQIINVFASDSDKIIPSKTSMSTGPFTQPLPGSQTLPETLSPGSSEILYNRSSNLYKPDTSLAKPIDLGFDINKVNELPNNLSVAYKKAIVNAPVLDKKLEKIASKFKGDYEIRIKNPERALAKYNKGKMPRDLLGSRIFVKKDSFDDVIKEIKKNYEINSQDRFDKLSNKWGYNGVNLNVKDKNNFIHEIQIHTPENKKILKNAHKIMEKWRGKDTTNLIQPERIDYLKDKKYSNELFNGKEKRIKLESAVYKRLKEELPPELQGSVDYNKMNMKKDAEKAVELIEKDKNKALRVGLGFDDAPAGQTSTAVNIALAEKAQQEGNFALQGRLIKNRSLAQSKRGQEIVAEKGSITSNGATRYIKELLSKRMDTLGGNYLDTFNLKRLAKTNKTKTAATEKIVREAEKIGEKVKQMDIEEAQKVLDSLACDY